MSVSLYRYTTNCDGKPCAGDCDLCKEVEQDGWVTWEMENEVISDSQKVLPTVPASTKDR